MKFTISTEYIATRMTIGDILGGKYKHADFIEDELDDPWPYNEEWFREQNKNKIVWVLEDPDEKSKLEVRR